MPIWFLLPCQILKKYACILCITCVGRKTPADFHSLRFRWYFFVCFIAWLILMSWVRTNVKVTYLKGFMRVGTLLLHNHFSTKRSFLSIDGLLSLKIDLDMPFWECSSKTIKMTYLYVFYEVGSLPLDTTIHYQRYISLKPWASISKNWLRYVILKIFALKEGPAKPYGKTRK